MNYTKIFIFLFIVVTALDISAGETSSELSCKYPVYSDIDGIHKAKDFNLKFRVEHASRKAYVVGNNDVLTEVNLLPQADSSGFSFVEITDSGNLITTTIDNEGSSVHSRNVIMFGKLIPSQYYGICTSK